MATLKEQIATHKSCIEDISTKLSTIVHHMRGQRQHIQVQDRQIEILMELVNEQRDTIQLIKYAFED